MHHFIARHHRREIRALECQVQHVAVIAPVGAEDEQHPLVLGRRFLLGLPEFHARIRIRGVNIFLHVRRLLQVRRIRSFHTHDPPLISLLLPALSVGHVYGLAIRQPALYFSFENDVFRAGSLFHADDFHLHAARFQCQPEGYVRIGVSRDAVRLNVRRRFGAIEGLQSRRLSCDDRAPPLVERRKPC